MIINWYTGIRIDQQLCNNYVRTIVELYIFHINCYRDRITLSNFSVLLFY